MSQIHSVATTFLPRRDPAYAAAVRRAEEAADPKDPAPSPADPVARTRRGFVVRRNGSMFTPGPHYDADAFNALPIE